MSKALFFTEETDGRPHADRRAVFFSPIPNLQQAVLDCLKMVWLNGRELREQLATLGYSHKESAFALLMGRMITAGLVEGVYSPIKIGRNTVRQRSFKATPKGLQALRDATEAAKRIIASRVWVYETTTGTTPVSGPHSAPLKDSAPPRNQASRNEQTRSGRSVNSLPVETNHRGSDAND